MNCQKPALSSHDLSVVSTVTALHSYFRNMQSYEIEQPFSMQSYYKVLQGQIISELEYTNHPETVGELKNRLNKINLKLKYIHVLNNSASTVDEIVHLEEMKHEFDCLPQPLEI